MANPHFLEGFRARLIAAPLILTALSAFGGETAEYPVLTHADYEAATGCDTYVDHYERALRIALTFLIFEDEPVSRDVDFEHTFSDVGYVRRHSRDSLAPMFASAAAGGACLHPTIEKIGEDVGFPEADRPQPATRVRNPEGDEVVPYLMTSRSEYVQLTGCLVSMSTYDHFRVAFFEHVLSSRDLYDAAARMRTFLRETGEGKHTDDGFLEPTCMTPTMDRIAGELKLLEESGRFAVQ